ncbi:hypothetical protein [Cupriavidus taiwanensis]|uniref:Uncharacterized protein n=1 Tax=Cupriavidus taiwanensis (strain DSM 17343 / BCRC 17206 / CCUG 44338 / CIP 107171 / LMG 19424 / R1) TaxID=977880 RepID=B3R9K7_CUPTR|nr:hypothetical protein [Cupriavidus taiwanensis]CAQ71582.1 hypothetical protein RALTA_B0971 [Cupriavidus taiwanensis LMG 19424]
MSLEDLPNSRTPDLYLTAAQREAEYPRFERWWQDHGRYCRAGGGEYEKSFAWASWQYLRASLHQQPLTFDAREVH